MNAERAEFTTDDIPWPEGGDEILLKVAAHRRKGRSIGASVGFSIVEESHDFSQDLLGFIPHRNIDESIKAYTISTLIASHYARPAYSFLCAEEVLRTGEPNPSISLPDEAIAEYTIDFFMHRATLTGRPIPEEVLCMENALTVAKAGNLITDTYIAKKLPGMEPPEFVIFILTEEIRMLDAVKGLNPGFDWVLRLALLNGSQRFGAIYDLAQLHKL